MTISGNQYNFIAVEGVIGVGKTTLARTLAQELDAQLIEEEFEENPFLPKFYKDPAHYAFQTQIFFLLSRYRQFKELNNWDLFHNTVVSDHMFEKDKIFAYINLNESELRLYEEVEHSLATMLPSPDLVIYLQAEPQVLLKRIRKRNRSYEKKMDNEYIDQLVKAYNYFFFQYDESPVLVVNTDNLDLTQEPVQKELLDRINNPVRGIEYYNPGKTLWE